MDSNFLKKRSKPNRGGGKPSRGRSRGRGTSGSNPGRGSSRGGGVGRGSGGGGGGWSSSRKGGLDLDDSLDGPVLNDPHYNSHHEEEYRPSSGKNSFHSSSSRARGRGSYPKVKVEMQQLHMTMENQMMVQDTLLSLQSGDTDAGLNFAVRDEYDDDDEDGDYDSPEYDELDAKVGNRYWIPERGLVIQDALVFNTPLNNTAGSAQIPQENFYAIKRLQRCGFSTELCQEALQISDGDTGAALEYLLSELFDIHLTVTESEEINGDNSEGEQEILESRGEEKLALESIYDCDFEERIPNKMWLLNLKLPELHQLLDSKFSRKTQGRSTNKCALFI